MREKYTKEQVNYGEGEWGHNCGICAHFRDNGLCTMVIGDIKADDGCRIFEKSLLETIRSAAKGETA
jgi:hypothetical protein